MSAVYFDRRIDSSVADAAVERRNPQITYREAQKEIARVVREQGSLLKISAISDTVVGSEPSNSVEIFLQVGKGTKTTPKEKTTKTINGAIYVSSASDFFQIRVHGFLMNDAVQAIKRAYFSWKSN